MEKTDTRDLPVLGTTLGQLEKAFASEEYSTFALARVILQDPLLTAKVLRVANSAYYNPGGHPISLVSRAVMVLGFDVVRSICTTITAVDAFVKGTPRRRLLDEIARSLFAAVVARRLAVLQHDPSPEEVFISTLLSRLGHIAFWSLSGSDADLLDRELRGDVTNAEAVEIRCLGFALDDLSVPLSELWGLPMRAIDGRSSAAESRRRLQAAAQAAVAAICRGWEHPSIDAPVREIAWILSATVPEAVDFLAGLAREAAEMLGALGSDLVAQRVPTREEGQPEPVAEEDELSKFGEGDPDAERRVLHEISANLLEGMDVNTILEMVLEGIHRGVGMDRTALAILDPRTGEVRCKYVLGLHRHVFRERFLFAMDGKERHILVELMAGSGSALIDPGSQENARKLGHPIYELFAGRPFLAQAVVLRGRAVGIFVADRHSSGRPVDRDMWDNFRLLVRQADIALALSVGARP